MAIATIVASGETCRVQVSQEPVQITDGTMHAFIQPMTGSMVSPLQFCASPACPAVDSAWHTLATTLVVSPPLVLWCRVEEGETNVVVTSWRG
ncbi:hypothetical protein F2I39_19770 [Escherichia coli]|nr:hypothetical protein [Escherichia coli]